MLPPSKYPNENNANFALFHFTGNVNSIEKFVVSGINKYSVEEIEELRQTEMDQAVKISKNPWFTSIFFKKTNSQKIKEPDKALCCSLAISSSDPKDQLKIKFYDTHRFMKGVGIVIEDPKKVLVPHADYFAFNSGGILPPNLVKNDFLTSSPEGTNIDLRSIDDSLYKPVRGVFYSARLPSFSVTNYASYSHEDKGVLENRGGEKGFFNFARNFYRTSLHGKSKHVEPKWNRKSKYYPFDSSTQKRSEANYTELLVYQKKGEDNPVNGVVLNMDVLRFGKGDVEKLKALFEKNKNLALYIYDSSLETDCIRKVEGKDVIKNYLDLIKSKMSESGSCFELVSNRSAVKEANSKLPVFQNQILRESSVSAVDEGGLSNHARSFPKVATLEDDVKKSFEGFYKDLDTKEKVFSFLTFLWGGQGSNAEYDILKDQLVERHKDKFTGNGLEIPNKARRVINDLNRQSAIEKLKELSQKEAGESHTETVDFVQNYHQIHSELRLDKFLENDEFNLGKKEMLTFVMTKNKSERLKKIDELKEFVGGRS